MQPPQPASFLATPAQAPQRHAALPAITPPRFAPPEAVTHGLQRQSVTTRDSAVALRDSISHARPLIQPTTSSNLLHPFHARKPSPAYAGSWPFPAAQPALFATAMCTATPPQPTPPALPSRHDPIPSHASVTSAESPPQPPESPLPVS